MSLSAVGPGRTALDPGGALKAPVVRRPRVTVIGTGHLGATHAVALAAAGLDVLGVDADPAVVAALTSGRVPFHEPGLAALLRDVLATGRLRFTDDVAEAAEVGDVHLLCVGTPRTAGSPVGDTSHLHAAVGALGRHLRRRALVVGRSTVPPGTAQRLRDTLHAVAPAGTAVELAWAPSALRVGHALTDALRPDRLVLGSASAWAAAQARAAFAPLLDAGTPLVECDLATAELVAVAASSLLATRLSHLDAMAEICEATGADVRLLARALGHEDDTVLGAGAGLGPAGGSLPADLRALTAGAAELGVGPAVAFLREVDAVTVARRSRTVDLVRQVAGGDLRGVRVAALGAASAPGTDDVQDATALAVASMLQEDGAHVVVFDPEAADNARRARPGLTFASSLPAAVQGADVVVLLTEWEQFRAIDPEMMGWLVARRRVVDARHALDADAYRAAGWEYRAPGRPAVPHPATVVRRR